MLRSIHKSTKVWVPQSCPDRHRSTTSTSMTAITREKRPLGPSCRKSTRSSEFLPCFWHILRLSSSIILSHSYLQMISHSQPYLFCIWLLWSGSKGWPSLWVIAHCGRATEMKFILKFVCDRNLDGSKIDNCHCDRIPKLLKDCWLWTRQWHSQNENFIADQLFPQQILRYLMNVLEFMWIKNCQINSNTTVVHCIPHATQGQVSVRCEATTIHSTRPNISHLRLLLDHGYLQHPNFVSTAIVQQLTPKSSTAFHGHWCSFKKDSDTKSETKS